MPPLHVPAIIRRDLQLSRLAHKGIYGPHHVQKLDGGYATRHACREERQQARLCRRQLEMVQAAAVSGRAGEAGGLLQRQVPQGPALDQVVQVIPARSCPPTSLLIRMEPAETIPQVKERRSTERPRGRSLRGIRGA